MSDTDPDYRGRLYVATCSCGGATAMGWEEGMGTEIERARTLADWASMGDEVSSVERYKGDSMPWWCECGRGDDEPLVYREGCR